MSISLLQGAGIIKLEKACRAHSLKSITHYFLRNTIVYLLCDIYNFRNF
jgi:hypothetical protein